MTSQVYTTIFSMTVSFDKNKKNSINIHFKIIIHLLHVFIESQLTFISE